MKPTTITSVTLLWLVITDRPDGNADVVAGFFNQCHETTDHDEAISATRAAGAEQPDPAPESAEAFAYSFAVTATSTTR